MDMKQLQEKLTAIRRDIHAHPETAFEEVRTAGIVADELRRLGLDVHTGIGGTGIVANLKVGDGAKVIGLRADMDAIALTEKGERAYISRNPGKMHGCGHDGHTTTLIGAAMVLAERKNFNGTVRFIFQPAEEPGKGARAMIDDGLFERFPVDEIYCIHNDPTAPINKMYTRVGPACASEDDFVIRITGKGGHASAPHAGIDPLAAAATIYMGLQTIVSRSINPMQPAVVSVTEWIADGGHNAIPTSVELRGDTRSYTPENSALIEKRMREICENACAMYGAKCEFTYTHEFYPTINNELCVKKAVKAARTVLGAENVTDNMEPNSASEDFGVFLRTIPGCYLALGTGQEGKDNIPVHNAGYDFNDEALLTGVEFWAELVHQCLD